MEENKKITVGVFAHVDAGKTTLSEAMLYISGSIRKFGRVDHGDTFLDTDPIEKERGITVFSSCALFKAYGTDFTLLDTPGHTDFSTEAERTLSIIDYAILVVSAQDIVQNHTKTLWELLRTYSVPVFIFVNKTDLPNKGEEYILSALQNELDQNCFIYQKEESEKERNERLAFSSDDLLDIYSSNGKIETCDISSLISERRLFPVFFGSALKMQGVNEFLKSLSILTLMPEYSEYFGAKVFKITKDKQSSRLTFLKVTGGKLSVRDSLSYFDPKNEGITEKISQIRFYSGDRFIQSESAYPGDVCAVIGLSKTFSGEGLGIEPDSEKPILSPVMTYSVVLPEGCDPLEFYPKMKSLEEEDPALSVVYDGETKEIRVRIMGEMQIEVLKKIIPERFGIDIDFKDGKILYKETVASTVEGMGHFEPLRHYAEVHLLIEPLEEGGGVIYDSSCPDGMPDRNWQKVILSSLAEKNHRGVLIGAPLSDVRITLIAGKAHLKHTDGGDFREAAYRAVRHGLMCAESVLLEPMYSFRIEIPSAYLGKLLNDLSLMDSQYEIKAAYSDSATVCGRVSVYEMQGYALEMSLYSKGTGRISLTFDGYSPCHNKEKIIEKYSYNPESDIENPPHSVFCAHGAGFVVNWDKAKDYMHIESSYSKGISREPALPSYKTIGEKYSLSDREVEEIMSREFGPIKRRKYSLPTVVGGTKDQKIKERKKGLIIDGYNIIFAWDSLKKMAESSLEASRDSLMNILSNYVAFTKTDLTLVFDAYKVKNSPENEFMHDGYKVVYTKEGESADIYIEKLMKELGPDYDIRVVTSDRLIQLSAIRSGIIRISAREFEEEIRSVSDEISEFIRKLSNNK